MGPMHAPTHEGGLKGYCAGNTSLPWYTPPSKSPVPSSTKCHSSRLEGVGCAVMLGTGSYTMHINTASVSETHSTRLSPATRGAAVVEAAIIQGARTLSSALYSFCSLVMQPLLGAAMKRNALGSGLSLVLVLAG